MNDLTKTTESPKWFKVILLLGMLLFAFYGSTHMVAAGDTWVAMACGRHFANHGVDTVEPFSFNSHPAGPSDETLSKAGWPEWTHGIIRKVHPTGWINQNWLTHLTFYKLATWFGEGDNYNFNALVYWKFALYFITVLIVYATGRLIGLTDILAAAAACFALVIGRTFYDIRPAGYSNMLVPALILIMAMAMYKNYRLIWLVVPLVVFWANVHGGYIYAFIMFVPFVGINLLLRLPRRWTLCLGFIGVWLVMYIMSHNFITHKYYTMVQDILRRPRQDISLLGNNMFWAWILLAAGSLALTIPRKIPAPLFYGYHIVAGVIFFFSLLLRFLPSTPSNLTDYFEKMYSYFVWSSRMSFIFVFIAGSLLICAMALKKQRFLSLPVNGIYHTIGAGAVALAAMVIFNPFHLTNLTHTFEISVSKHAESWRQVAEWKPAFDWMDKLADRPNMVGDEEAFGVLCVLTLAGLLIWLVAYFLKRQDAVGTNNKKKPSSESATDTCSWPKIDLALLVIALLTIYMAVRSRRFIAIAGATACPFIFLLFKEAFANIPRKVNTILSIILVGISIFFILSWNVLFKDFEKLISSWQTRFVVEILVISLIGSLYFLHNKEKMPNAFRTAPAYLFTTGIIILACHWGAEYKRVYLDPWPSDNQYNTVFMRMTASHLKPTEACEFIRHNEISGKVFNYWTEGGAVALGQKPDEKTGHIPLKLFMDGRAQAAYNHDKFKLWQDIFSGGPIAQKARLDNSTLSQQQWGQIGERIDAQLGNDVWVVLMPSSQEDSTFMRALLKTGHWKTAYQDNIQHLLVNARTPQGEKLIGDVLAGQVWFPSEYSKCLTTFVAITENNLSGRYSELYSLAKRAFDIFPYPSATIAMIRLENLPAFRDQVLNDFKNYLDDFVAQNELYESENGYLQRLTSADVCAKNLARSIPQESQKYSDMSRQLNEEAAQIKGRSIW